MDDIDIFKYRTKKLESAPTELAPAPTKPKKHSANLVAKPKTDEELFDEDITRKAENDYKYVSEYTRLATLDEGNHPLRDLYLSEESVNKDLFIFENVPFGPKVENNLLLSNIMLRQEKECQGTYIVVE
jgi:hypothetical protein